MNKRNKKISSLMRQEKYRAKYLCIGIPQITVITPNQQFLWKKILDYVGDNGTAPSQRNLAKYICVHQSYIKYSYLKIIENLDIFLKLGL